jgi:hypothetical protein
VHTKLSRFPKKVPTLAQSRRWNPEPVVQKGDGGYANWVIVSIQGLKIYLDLPYRRLLVVGRYCGLDTRGSAFNLAAW